MPRLHRRIALALALAVVALVAAVVGAVGPAEHVQTTYTWPPQTLPAGKPTRSWYTPLLLVRRQPEKLAVRVPCALPPALNAAERPLTIISTARFPERFAGLAVIRDGTRLVVRVGNDVLAQVSIADPGIAQSCSYELVFHDRRWSLEGGPNQASLGGDLEMPVVNGVFSSLDLHSGTPPSIDVTTGVHASRTTARQTVSWVIAVLCAIAALLLIAVQSRPRRLLTTASSAVRSAVRHARPADAVVFSALLGWWVIGPAYYDDGWVVARQSMFSSSGGFSNYYDSLGGNHPLGYWLEWAQHWLTQETTAILVLRVPALLCLAATWVLCRWIVTRVLASSRAADDRVALWALTSAFVVGAFAWGMTLRPEPEIALLVIGVMACTVRFVERETFAPLAVAAILVALALTTHPSAIVSIAPLIVVLPKLLPLVRARAAEAIGLVTAATAVLLVLGAIGSDVQQRRDDAGVIRTYGNAVASWREELNRYADLMNPGYGTPLRRESVALMALAILAYLMRSRRERQPLLDLPATALAFALILLIPTPSKWPWHFGMLIGIGVVAVAAETARLRQDARLSQGGWSVRPLLVIGVAVVAASWSWAPRQVWGDLDLRTLDWTLGIETPTLNFSKLAALVPLVLLVGLGIVELIRRRWERLGEVPWRIASWTAPILAVPLLAFTVGVLVTDAAKTDSWTLTRQNLDVLRGDATCGLADDALVAKTASMRPAAEQQADGGSQNTPAWVPPPPIEGLPRFALGPAGPASTARSPWLDASTAQPIGVFLTGAPDRVVGKLELEWGRARGGEIKSFGSVEISAALAPEVRSDMTPWRFFPAGELPSRPRGANALRIALRSDVSSGAAVAITAPVTYANDRLAEQLEQDAARTLVPPNLLTFVPCVEQPLLRGGIVEAPAQIVALRDSLWPVVGRFTAPFEGVLDLYSLERLPLTDSKHPPGNVVLYDVVQEIPGAVQAQPDARTVVS